jgi:poly(A) polymerase
VIKKFIQKMLGRDGGTSRASGTASATGARNKRNAHGPRKYTQAEHGIDRRDISEPALRTCEGLQQAGFEAFVVGGAVRDLLLGRHPKDFDVATDATPEEVRGVFRRSRIIGRRFRIVHVMFGQETVEVSTFRAAHVPAPREEDEDDSPEQKRGHADEHGRLLRDNVFGTQEEDAIRRDFTMNALFYNPATEEVWDYVHGVADIQKKRVVMIGEPVARYREDPVRMLRAARLAGKLGFEIDPPTEKPIAEMASLLDNVPSARLFDEMLKLLLSGHALECIERLRALNLHRQLLPVIDSLLRDPASRAFVELALQRTDQRIAEDRGVSPAFLFAALFWFPMRARQAALEAKGMRTNEAMHNAMDDVLDEQRKSLAIPRRYDPMVKELWVAQPRLVQRSAGKAFRMLAHPKFRACYDFLELRASAGDAPTELAEWWEEFQVASEEERADMLLPDNEPKKKRRRRRRKSGGDPAGGANDGAASSDGEPPQGEAPQGEPPKATSGEA